MILQTLKTRCEDCGEELKSRVGVMTGNNEIIIDFIDGMEFYCEDCGTSTFIEIRKYTS